MTNTTPTTTAQATVLRHVRIKRVMRRDGTMIRLCRVMWERGIVGDGHGYSVKLSLALVPALFRFRREYQAWILCLLGIRIHYRRSYGGIFV